MRVPPCTLLHSSGQPGCWSWQPQGSLPASSTVLAPGLLQPPLRGSCLVLSPKCGLQRGNFAVLSWPPLSPPRSVFGPAESSSASPAVTSPQATHCLPRGGGSFRGCSPPSLALPVASCSWAQACWLQPVLTLQAPPHSGTPFFGLGALGGGSLQGQPGLSLVSRHLLI